MGIISEIFVMCVMGPRKLVCLFPIVKIKPQNALILFMVIFRVLILFLLLVVPTILLALLMARLG